MIAVAAGSFTHGHMPSPQSSPSARGYPAATLSTFRDVPWNGPFYRNHGFRDLQRAEWTPGMPAIRDQEARHGLRVQARVFMRRELSSRAR